MSLIQFLFGFQGRVRRLHLWLFTIGMCVAVAVLVLLLRSTVAVDHSMTSTHIHNGNTYTWNGHLYTFAAPWLALVVLPLAWIKLAVLVKRWHDRNKSGFWVLIVLIPVIGPIWQMIECFFLPGTDGPNKYGPSPK